MLGLWLIIKGTRSWKNRETLFFHTEKIMQDTNGKWYIQRNFRQRRRLWYMMIIFYSTCHNQPVRTSSFPGLVPFLLVMGGFTPVLWLCLWNDMVSCFMGVRLVHFWRRWRNNSRKNLLCLNIKFILFLFCVCSDHIIRAIWAYLRISVVFIAPYRPRQFLLQLIKFINSPQMC